MYCQLLLSQIPVEMGAFTRVLVGILQQKRHQLFVYGGGSTGGTVMTFIRRRPGVQLETPIVGLGPHFGSAAPGAAIVLLVSRVEIKDFQLGVITVHHHG